MISLTGGSYAGAAVVPMAFQSALAGIGLAAGLVKHAAALPVPPSTSTRVNLLRPLASILADPRARDATGRCICCDEDFIEAYRRKYPGGGSRSTLSSKKLVAIAATAAFPSESAAARDSHRIDALRFRDQVDKPRIRS